MSDTAKVLWLSQEQVIAAGGLDMVTIMGDVEDVFRLRAACEYVLPGKLVLHWDEPLPGDEENHDGLDGGLYVAR